MAKRSLKVMADGFKVPGLLLYNMEAKHTPFQTLDECPTCGKTTDVVKLGSLPAREVCRDSLCEWGGRSLEGVKHQNDDGTIVIE